MTASSEQVVIVRPENCAISREENADHAFCAARVEWVEYLGTIQRVRLTIGEHEVTVDLPGRHAGFASGENVFVGWSGDHALVVPAK